MSLPPIVIEFVRLSIWLALLAAIFVPIEQVFAAHPRKVFRKGTGADLCYYFVSGILPAIVLSVPLSVLALAVRKIMPEAYLNWVVSLPLWARVVGGLLAGEFGYYWGHRLSHEIPVLWSFHAIHHSAEELDFLVNTRAHPVDLAFSRFSSLVPMYILGLSGPVGPQGSLVPVIVGLIGTAWGFFIHANVKWRLGPVEKLVSTPAFHHWHHTRSGPIDKNFASTIPLFDRIFGTHYLPSDELPVDYGIREPMPDAFVDQLIHPFFGEPSGKDSEVCS